MKAQQNDIANVQGRSLAFRQNIAKRYAQWGVMKKLILISCVAVIISCAKEKNADTITKEFFNPIAIALNDSAVNIMLNSWGIGITDSMAKRCFAFLDSAISIEPHYVVAYANKIRLQQELKQYNDAINTTKALLSIENAPEYLVQLGMLYQLSGDTQSARKNYNDAFEIYTERVKSGCATNADTMNFFFVEYLLNGKSQTFQDIKSLSPQNCNYYIEFFESINHDPLLSTKQY